MQSGAAAVEAGLVTTFLMPLLIGVLFYGNYFWHAQKVDAYAPRIAQGGIVGSQLTCDELVDRVKATVLSTVNGVRGSGLPLLTADQITADVIEVLPTVGAVVRVGVHVPVASSLTSLLPNNGAVVTETTMRLQNVTLSTSSC